MYDRCRNCGADVFHKPDCPYCGASTGYVQEALAPCQVVEANPEPVRPVKPRRRRYALGLASILLGGFIGVRLAMVVGHAVASLPTTFWVVTVAGVVGIAAVTAGAIAYRRAGKEGTNAGVLSERGR
jgi:hypothetical protein